GGSPFRESRNKSMRIRISLPALLTFLFAFSVQVFGQVPVNVGIQILKAEDARRYDKTLEDLLANPNAAVRTRAALAAGRIGREEAIEPLVNLLQKDPSADVRTMAAFALGEIESIKAADAILSAFNDPAITPALFRLATKAPNGWFEGTMADNRIAARLIEAAGKIAA